MKKKIKIGICIIILILVILYGFIKFKNLNSLDNFLIFNLYDNSIDNKYIFNLDKENGKTISVNLLNTLSTQKMAKRKVAPGMSGEFEIVIFSSKKSDYQIYLESKNEKPKNLIYNIKNDSKKYENIEELNKFLNGTTLKNGNKSTIIQWSWDYDTNEQNNKQDTFDGKNIEEYYFNISIFCNTL